MCLLNPETLAHGIFFFFPSIVFDIQFQRSEDPKRAERASCPVEEMGNGK